MKDKDRTYLNSMGVFLGIGGAGSAELRFKVSSVLILCGIKVPIKHHQKTNESLLIFLVY